MTIKLVNNCYLSIFMELNSMCFSYISIDGVRIGFVYPREEKAEEDIEMLP